MKIFWERARKVEAKLRAMFRLTATADRVSRRWLGTLPYTHHSWTVGGEVRVYPQTVIPRGQANAIRTDGLNNLVLRMLSAEELNEARRTVGRADRFKRGGEKHTANRSLNQCPIHEDVVVV